MLYNLMTPNLFPVNQKFSHCWYIDLIWGSGDFELLWGLVALDSLYVSPHSIVWEMYLYVPLFCWVVKWLGGPLGIKTCNTVVIVLGICDGFLLLFALGKKLDNQEVFLDGGCVGYLLGFVLGVIIGISVGKPDGDKLVCWIGIILGTVLNTELGNCEGFSLYW